MQALDLKLVAENKDLTQLFNAVGDDDNVDFVFEVPVDGDQFIVRPVDPGERLHELFKRLVVHRDTERQLDSIIYVAMEQAVYGNRNVW